MSEMLCAMSRKALRRSAGKALSVDIYERGDHRYHVVWKDETGQRCFASRGSLAEAKRFQTQKIAELRIAEGCHQQVSNFTIDGVSVSSNDCYLGSIRRVQPQIGRSRLANSSDLRWLLKHRGNSAYFVCPKNQAASKEVLVPEKKGRDLKPFAWSVT